MNIQSTHIPGLQILHLTPLPDHRGNFVKTFHWPTLDAAGLDFELKESYYSISNKNVIRGMHFQLPPHAHTKIVYCPQGRILDVVLDIRKHSPTFGQFFSIELNSEQPKALYIPEGLAHGFLSLEDNSMTCYLQSTAYAPTHDAGIHYDSFGMNWGISHPIISQRDSAFPKLQNFNSPF